MKPSVVVALVAAGVIAGGSVATYELTRPAGQVGVQFVTPASQVAPTTEPTATPSATPSATTTTSATTAVTSSSTTRKAAVRTKEGTVSEPVQSSTTTQAVQPSPAMTKKRDDVVATVEPTQGPVIIGYPGDGSPKE